MPEEPIVVDVKGRTFKLAKGEELQALEHIRFELPANSFTCIVGPSGCGKTTTLRMILRLDKDFDGQVTIPGEGVVAAVFQEPRLLPWRTVEQNIRLVLPKERVHESIDELLTILGLDQLRDFYPNQLSLGLARRASLARAFIVNPQLLILDEPFVSLDAATVARLRVLLLTLWQARPTTALMVTHDMLEAATLADQVLVFSERPAQIVKRVVIDTPREKRTPDELQQIACSLAATTSGRTTS